jgi:hypothetical protein
VPPDTIRGHFSCRSSEHDRGTSCRPEDPIPLRDWSDGTTVRRTEDAGYHKQRCEESLECDGAYELWLGMIGLDGLTDLTSGVLGD